MFVGSRWRSVVVIPTGGLSKAGRSGGISPRMGQLACPQPDVSTSLHSARHDKTRADPRYLQTYSARPVMATGPANVLCGGGRSFGAAQGPKLTPAGARTSDPRVLSMWVRGRRDPRVLPGLGRPHGRPCRRPSDGHIQLAMLPCGPPEFSAYRPTEPVSGGLPRCRGCSRRDCPCTEERGAGRRNRPSCGPSGPFPSTQQAAFDQGRALSGRWTVVDDDFGRGLGPCRNRIRETSQTEKHEIAARKCSHFPFILVQW